jgi:AraC-like DNA-binding protein
MLGVTATNDPLSDVLRSVRLTGGVFLDARFTAPWCISAQMTEEDCTPFLPEPGHVIAYHVVVEGRLMLSIGNDPPAPVDAGEIILLPRNDHHTMGSAAGLLPVRAGTLIQPAADGGLARIEHGGTGEPTRLICGYLGCGSGYSPLIASLPRALTVDVRHATSRDWIEASVRYAAGEIVRGQLASSDVISRLAELLLVEAVRQYSGTVAESQAGWLRGLRDPHVGRALALIHSDIRTPWSAAALAREVALSRSAFVDRFKSLVGLPPIRYITAWRLETARQQLRESAKSVSQLAHAVGYESEEAFSRAFKREFGLSPAHWRERQAQR